MTGAVDPIALQVLIGALRSACEEMGAVLVRSAHSPNIKERRDCSTALFDAKNSLRSARAFLSLGPASKRADALALVAAVAAAKTDAELPKLPTGAEVALVSGHGGNGGIQNTWAHATMVLGVDR